jgi:tetratricopeptide (TPR) repeat protein
MPSHRFRTLASAALAAAGLWVWSAAPARADEIVTRHPETCELVTIRAAEILPETWNEVEYREKERGPTKKVPMSLVVEIKRSTGGKDKSNLEAAIQELERGNLTDARTALRETAGGGYSVSEGQRFFTSFVPKGAGTARGKRPSWIAEYAHFHYAKALVLEGEKTGNAKLLEEALLCLDDVPNPAPAPPPKDAPKEKDTDAGTTGGFLGRFKGGNSRWLPEAMHLKARALVGLKRYDEAAAVWEDLFKEAVGASLSPRWVFEAKTGPGFIAKAQGDVDKAVQQYERAPTALEAMLAQAPNRCIRLEIGRYFSQVRARAAALLLEKAQNGGPGAASAFITLKTFLEEGQPEALQAKFGSRPPEQLEALMAGARDPQVQAVAQTGLGLAFLNDGKYDEAIAALTSVTVRYFAAREYAANALFHLAKAAEKAAEAPKPGAKDAKATYTAIKDNALKRLKDEYPDSTYATR